MGAFVAGLSCRAASMQFRKLALQIRDFLGSFGVSQLSRGSAPNRVELPLTRYPIR
jgi:hypothetical protein